MQALLAGLAGGLAAPRAPCPAGRAVTAQETCRPVTVLLDQLDLVAVRVADDERATVRPAADVIRLAVAPRDLYPEVPCELADAVELGDDEAPAPRSEEHTPELQSRENLVCR